MGTKECREPFSKLVRIRKTTTTRSYSVVRTLKNSSEKPVHGTADAVSGRSIVKSHSQMVVLTVISIDKELSEQNK